MSSESDLRRPVSNRSEATSWEGLAAFWAIPDPPNWIPSTLSPPPWNPSVWLLTCIAHRVWRLPEQGGV